MLLELIVAIVLHVYKQPNKPPPLIDTSRLCPCEINLPFNSFTSRQDKPRKQVQKLIVGLQQVIEAPSTISHL
jgi:hypothetical protein